MERWLKILMGTFFGSLGSVVFYLIFDRVMQWVRAGRGSRDGTGGKNSLRMRVKLRQEQRSAEEVESLVYEEFDTEQHEVLSVCLESEGRVAGGALFLSDRKVEFYSEEYPACCQAQADQEPDRMRHLLAAVSVWAEKWTLAEAVNCLVEDEAVVRGVSRPGSSQWRAVNQFEAKHDFRFFIQGRFSRG